jgi:hypothetical protein
MSDRICSVCHKVDTETPIQQCSRCKERFYCGPICQRADWSSHKNTCAKARKWYDKHRKCMDGHSHEGRLELITWPCKKEGTGWGHCFVEESDDLCRKFTTEFSGDEEKLYGYWPQGFRWTCCGTDGGMEYGCDHHGTGSKPCTCDFCTMGKPLPSSIYNEQSASRMGLQLPRGPDPRSFNVGLATVASSMRPMLGMDN